MESQMNELKWNEEILCWVPVTHAMPEPGKVVLVQDDCGDVDIAVVNDSENFEDRVLGTILDGIICWSDLPEGPAAEVEEWPEADGEAAEAAEVGGQRSEVGETE